MELPDLESIRRAFDREGVSALEAVVERTPPTEAWLDRLVDGVAVRSSSVPATWLLRATLARGGELTRAQTAALLRALEGVTEDDARLHLCQVVAHVDIPARNAEQLARFLRAGAAGEHKFVRAWATDALWRLAVQHPRYRAEAAVQLERAGRDAAASVRARARRVIAEVIR